MVIRTATKQQNSTTQTLNHTEKEAEPRQQLGWPQAGTMTTPASNTSALDFLSRTHPAVRSHFAAAAPLSEFLDTVGDLSLSDRKLIVEQALVLMQENFVHLPLKRAMHGVDPLQKLRLIQHRLEETSEDTIVSEQQFHREMIEVFTSVRDLHTNYLLPVPFANKIAFLPFDIEESFDENGQPQYIASHFVQGFSHEHFKRGVTITQWNAVPIVRAIEISADEHAGSNLSARHVQGIDGLTIRAMRRSLPPDALWVIIGYTDLEGVARELKQAWIVTELMQTAAGVDANTISPAAVCLGSDLEADLIQRARKMLFAPEVIAKELSESEPNNKAQSYPPVDDPDAPISEEREEKEEKAKPGETLETQMEGIFKASSVSTPTGEFGYIRIFSFNVNDPDAFIDEFIRLAEQLPQQGLIIDVRSNGGGHIMASEGLLQVLTPREITPEPTQFLSTPLNTRICRRHKTDRVGIDLSPWLDSLIDAVETGAIYSQGVSITPHDFANGRGQKYHGPVVLITNARCYSATDIFAAGFKDHKIGHILGTDGNTGAGGANVWEHGLLSQLLQLPAPADTESPYENLPRGAGMRVAVRRTLRVGERAGTPLEDLGVVPDARHAMTKNDLLNGNEDLINAAGEILAGMPVRGLKVKATHVDQVLSIEATTLGIARLDVYVDGRPLKSLNVQDDTHHLELELSGKAHELKLKGYDEGEHVADRRLLL